MSLSDTGSYPVRLGSPEDFAVARAFLKQVGFDSALCRLLGMGEISDLLNLKWESTDASKISPALRWSAEIFLKGAAVEANESRSHCGSEVLAAFFNLGLLRPRKTDPNLLVCPVWLYPVEGFVVISDRRDDPDGGPFVPAQDVVFPAIYAGTLRFLEFLPEIKAEEAIDLCGGSGIGALRLSRTCRRTVTADLTPRSAFFAEFNARLNGAPVASLCGDLYMPVEGRQFDVITAHPPFVPATGSHMTYRDAGETGEDVTRGVIQGLPAHLRPGGICVVVCVARDLSTQRFEERAKAWLGPAAANFDVVFGLEKVLTVEQVVESMRKRGQGVSGETAQDLHSRLKSLDTRQFVYGVLFLRRYSEPVPQPPSRVNLTDRARATDFDRVFAWRRKAATPGFESWLATSRPCLANSLELTIRHAVVEGQLQPVESLFAIQNGFQAGLRPDGFVVPLVARLDGTKSVGEVYAEALAADELPKGFALNDFSGLIAMMVERGFLTVED
jgi:SAM-dependent methyltransferase